MSPTTMLAWTHTTSGSPLEILQLSPSHPVPTPTSTYPLLIKISYTSLSPGASIMMHITPSLFRPSHASIPELDFSGYIDSISSSEDIKILWEKKGLKVGSKVFGSLPVGQSVKNGAGTLAEYVVVSVESVLEIPKYENGMEMGMQEAAGLGVAGITAMALIEAADVKEGEKVLVNGASGGIGSMVVQMVRKRVGRGGKVVGVCSGRNREMILGLGVDEMVDYTEDSVEKMLRTRYGDDPFDKIIDAHGTGELYTHAEQYLKPSETAFTTVGIAHTNYSTFSVLYAAGTMLVHAWRPAWLGGGKRVFKNITGFVTEEGLQTLKTEVEEGRIEVKTEVYRMEEVLKVRQEA